MKMLDRYISRTIILSTLMVSAVIIGIQSFLAVVQQLQEIGVQNYTVWDALLSVPMELPLQYYQLFPMAGFLGAMIGLGKLSASSELIVMRAAGVSMRRIAWSVMKAATLMVIVMTLLGEGLGPLWQQRAEKMRYDDLYPAHTGALLQSIWLHEGNTFTHIHQLEDQKTMTGVTRYLFDSEGQLLKIITAKTASKLNGDWRLSDLVYTDFQKNSVTTAKKNSSSLHIVFRPNLQVQMKLTSVEQTLSGLYRTIQYRRMIGLDVSQFVYLFWQRIFQPLTSLIMISLAVPFVFGSYRSMSMSLRIIAGVMIGFIFYMMNQLFGPITLVYQFPPMLAALLPTCVFCLISIGLLLRAR